MLGTASASRPAAGGGGIGAAPAAGAGSFVNALAQAQSPVRAPERGAERSATAQRDPERPRAPAATPTASTRESTGPAPEAAPRSGNPARGKVNPAGQRPSNEPAPPGPATANACAPDPDPEDATPLASDGGDERGAATGEDSALAPSLEASGVPLAPAADPLRPTIAHRATDPSAGAATGQDATAAEALTLTGTGRDSLRPIAASLPAALTRPSPQLDADAATAADDDAENDPTPLALVGSTRRVAAALGDPTKDNPAPPSVNAAAMALHAAAETPSRGALALAGEWRSLVPVRDANGSRADAGILALPTGSAPSLSPSDPASGPVTASLAPPLDHPDFAQALGAQVAVWAAGGQHEAELQLNPGTLGPVQVWIGLDGAQAQVRFTADLATTRDALSAALPQLEQALAREGLQLGGADVQARDPRAGGGSAAEDGRGSRARARGEAVPGAEPLGQSARPLTASRGLIDLYA
jgi:flagellar hook-length control protein FliK